jgi:photosystem II stability/assembly factor-like uncharacterized protein
LSAVPVCAQFDIQDSHTTASLRGISTAGEQIAWASGSAGTILKTEDAGHLWQPCSVPNGAEKLDFRGIEALDATTAVLMSSGKGALSRIYKTTDGCKTWKLVFTNPDPDGFFDAIRRVTDHQFYVLGDPVNGKFAMFLSRDTAETWFIADDPGLDAEKGDGAFAASNSSLLALGATLYFGTGGTNAAHVYRTHAACPAPVTGTKPMEQSCPIAWAKQDVPVASHSAASGVFSLAGRTESSQRGGVKAILVAVGGTYDKPQDGAATAATSMDGGKTWLASTRPPAGYRSAVAFDREARVWIAVGTSGADLSRDDGKTWRPLLADGSTPDLAQGWNALALPYVVGSKGRIGKLRLEALTP